jgi:1,4-dihydroxy-2-naphthoate octaprenyltransferase
MVLRILGTLLAIFVAFMVVGAVIHWLFVLLIVGVIGFVGAAAYTAIHNRQRKHISR